MPSASESLAPATVPNAQQDLYRAALGPAHAEHYLSVFARFDERGASGLAWNTAAAAGSLGWLLYRRLWGAAAEFAAALAVWALIAAGLAFWVEVLPLGVRAGLALALLLLLVAVPGLYGTALLYAQVRQRMVEAVKQAATVEEACTLLRWQGDAQRRRGVWAVAGVLMAGAALGFALWLLPSALAPLPAAPVADAAANEPLADAPAKSAATAPSASVADEEAPAPTVDESAAADLPPTADAVPAGEAPASAADASVAAPLQEVAAPAPAPVAPVPATAPTAALPSAVAIRVKGYGVSVGLFAVADNAERARTKLEAAGLPVLMDPIESARGPITRVRVGPFETRAQAQAAAKKVGALGLDARVYAP